MKRITLGLACFAAVALMPRNASAALALSIGQTHNRSDAEPLPGRQFFDLIFNETVSTESPARRTVRRFLPVGRNAQARTE